MAQALTETTNFLNGSGDSLLLNLNKPKKICFGKLFLSFFFFLAAYDCEESSGRGNGLFAYVDELYYDGPKMTLQTRIRPGLIEERIKIQVGVN